MINFLPDVGARVGQVPLVLAPPHPVGADPDQRRVRRHYRSHPEAEIRAMDKERSRS